MATYRTAKGRQLDMGRLAAKNERVKAISNLNLNARGDQIDPQGRIIIPATQRASQRYQSTVTNRSANEINSELQKRRPVADIPKTPIAPSMPMHEDDLFLPDVLELDEQSSVSVTIKPASEAPAFVLPEPSAVVTKKSTK